MSTAHPNCPSCHELEQLLDGSLSSDQQQSCQQHMDNCACCQAKLEEIATGGSNFSQVVQGLNQADPELTSAYWPAFRAAGKALADSLSAAPRLNAPRLDTPDAGTRTRDTSLNFLLPPTDPAYLGRLGHFDVMRVLGRGGMGVVLEAFDSHLQRNVALKVLDPELAQDETSKQRFCREARAAASVTHENVVAVHQVERSVDGGPAFLVMQLIAGETLEERLHRENKLPLKEIVRIGMQAARGLAAAHAQGLTHRDIKPGNILLEPPGDRVKLTDFGLARVAEDVKLTRTGFVTGTPLYMAPEQAMGEAVDHRADLFSLGAILYEMAAGQPPFEGNSALAILKQIAETKHRPLRELNPEAPPWLAELIDELLAKKPADRYQTATDLAEVLEFHYTLMQGTSAELPAVCQVEKARLKKRNRLIFAGVSSTLAVAGLLLGMLISGGPATNNDVSSAEPVAVLTANAGTVWSVSFDPNSDTVAMAVEDGSVRLWDWRTRSVEATLPAHRGVVWSSQFSADGSLLATAGDDGLLKIWNRTNSAPIRVFEHPNAVRGLAIRGDGRFIAGDRKGGLRVWSLDSDEPVTSTEQPGAIYAVAISPSGETVATAGSDRIIRLWNAETLQQKLPLEGHAGPVNSLSFSSRGHRLASAGWDRTVRIWDTDSGSLVKSFEASAGDLWAVAYSPDGARLATAGQEGAVKLWNPETGELLATYLGHKTAVHTVVFKPDGALLASGGRDGAVRIWKVE